MFFYFTLRYNNELELSLPIGLFFSCNFQVIQLYQFKSFINQSSNFHLSNNSMFQPVISLQYNQSTPSNCLKNYSSKNQLTTQLKLIVLNHYLSNCLVLPSTTSILAIMCLLMTAKNDRTTRTNHKLDLLIFRKIIN